MQILLQRAISGGIGEKCNIRLHGEIWRKTYERVEIATYVWACSLCANLVTGSIDSSDRCTTHRTTSQGKAGGNHVGRWVIGDSISCSVLAKLVEKSCNTKIHDIHGKRPLSRRGEKGKEKSSKKHSLLYATEVKFSLKKKSNPVEDPGSRVGQRRSIAGE